MKKDEKINAHLLSVWMETKRIVTIGGKEGMLFLTDEHLIFVYKTKAKMKWWQYAVTRQITKMIKNKQTLIRHDGYNENNLLEDLQDKRNLEIHFKNILDVNHEQKKWGSVLNLSYMVKNKQKKCRFTIVQDWVKYPLKAPTKYMNVDWEQFIQKIVKR